MLDEDDAVASADTAGRSSRPLALTTPTSDAVDDENDSLTAEATQENASAPRMIRTPDLLIRRPARQRTELTSEDQPRKKSGDDEDE
jgi:hypothetical protein